MLHLRESEFAKATRIEQIIKHYSNFVAFPIELNGNAVNTVQALWTKNRNEISDAEYEGFYKYIGHDTEAPLYRLHFPQTPRCRFARFFLSRRRIMSC